MALHRQADQGAVRERTWSLRRDWGRAFVAMLTLLLVVAIVAIAGVWGLVGRVGSSARLLRQESAAVAALKTNLTAHEEIGHLLLSNEPVDRVAFVRQQEQISQQFLVTAKLFPTGNGTKAVVGQAARSWEAGLKTYGLWGAQALSLRGAHAADNPTFGASSDRTNAMVNGLEGPSLTALDRGLAVGDTLKKVLASVLTCLFAMALAMTIYFHRRMSRDFVRPIGNMHDGVMKLHGGRYDSLIDVARHDELGELAEAFNEMAHALRKSHEELTLRATHDSLTGLPNRASLTERLTSSLVSTHISRGESVLFVDVDDFKEVNDSLGHEGGDALLVQLATRLHSCVHPWDLVARLGGDEFALVVADPSNGSAAIEAAQRIVDAMRVPFLVGGTSLSVSVSIGVAARRGDNADVAELLRQADFAMYMAKADGKGRYQLFEGDVLDTLSSDNRPSSVTDVGDHGRRTGRRLAQVPRRAEVGKSPPSP